MPGRVVRTQRNQNRFPASNLIQGSLRSPAGHSQGAGGSQVPSSLEGPRGGQVHGGLQRCKPQPAGQERQGDVLEPISPSHLGKCNTPYFLLLNPAINLPAHIGYAHLNKE